MALPAHLVTAALERAEALGIADLVIHRPRNRLIAVREDHEPATIEATTFSFNSVM